MRLPLFRSGNDDSPTAWWEWLFLPIFMPIAFVLVILLGLLSIPYVPISHFLHRRAEKRLIAQMTEADRYQPWPEVRRKLEQGDGLLFAEWRNPKEGCRYWWTDGEFIDKADYQLPSDLEGCCVGDDFDPENTHFANQCVAHLIRPETGVALLTDLPTEDWGFAKDRMVTLCMLAKTSLIARCDPDSFFGIESNSRGI